MAVKMKHMFNALVVLALEPIFEGAEFKKINPGEPIPKDKLSWKQVDPDFRYWICAVCAINRNCCGCDIYEFGGYPKGNWLWRTSTRHMLVSDWKIYSREDHIVTIQDMMESVTPELPKVGKVWQYLRIIQNAGFGYVAEYLTLEEALNCALAAGRELQKVVSGWEELGEKYLEAYAIYMGKDSREFELRKASYQELWARQDNPYEKVPFDLELKKSW